MATVTIKGLVHKGMMDGAFVLFHTDMSHHGYAVIGPAELQYELPSDYNPVAVEVASLNKQLDALTEQFQTNVARIKGRIAELQCIENAASTGAA